MLESDEGDDALVRDGVGLYRRFAVEAPPPRDQGDGGLHRRELTGGRPSRAPGSARYEASWGALDAARG